MNHAYTRHNDEERRQWVLNDEGLYRWWQETRLPLKKFIRDNRVEIDAGIDRALNIKPRS